MSDTPLSAYEQHRYDDEISISELLMKLWAKRGLIVMLPLVFAGLTLVGLLVSKTSQQNEVSLYVELVGISLRDAVSDNDNDSDNDSDEDEDSDRCCTCEPSRCDLSASMAMHRIFCIAGTATASSPPPTAPPPRRRPAAPELRRNALVLGTLPGRCDLAFTSLPLSFKREGKSKSKRWGRG